MALPESIEVSLTREIGSFPSKAALKRHLRIGNEKLEELLEGLPCFPSGREKRYYAGDVAKRLSSQMTDGGTEK